MTKAEATKLIAAAAGLRGLRDACRAIHEAARAADGDPAALYDATSLPVYGGAEPASTAEIWSWDATHILIGSGPDVAAIEPRD